MYIRPIKAGIIYLDVNRVPNNRGLTVPKTGESSEVRIISLDPIPANVTGTKPHKIVKDIVKIPAVENKFIFAESAKICICNKLISQKIRVKQWYINKDDFL